VEETFLVRTRDFKWRRKTSADGSLDVHRPSEGAVSAMAVTARSRFSGRSKEPHRRVGLAFALLMLSVCRIPSDAHLIVPSTSNVAANLFNTSFLPSEGWTRDAAQVSDRASICNGTGFHGIQEEVSNGGQNIACTGSGCCDKVTTMANFGGGAGGRGFLHWVCDGQNCNNGGSTFSCRARNRRSGFVITSPLSRAYLGGPILVAPVQLGSDTCEPAQPGKRRAEVVEGR
jgi:hypothetical protein